MNINKSKISIVTPSHNSEKFIEETINSVLDQKCSNLEYIIIDGGSTDKTIDIIKKYEKYLSYWKSEKDSGMYNAINKGFNKSTGEIMGWINSDDILHKGSLSIINQIFSEFSSVNWITGVPNAQDKNSRITMVSDPPSWNKEKFYYDTVRSIQQESTFWRRDLWKKAGSALYEKYSLAADHELWARFFQYDDIYNIDSLLGSFRKHAGQLSQIQKKEYMNQVIEIRKQYSKKENKIHYYNYKMKKALFSIIPSKIANSANFKKILFNTKSIHYNFSQNKFKIDNTHNNE